MKNPFLVHIYSTVEGAEWIYAPFSEQTEAFSCAKEVFKHPAVYKVNVWDLRISQPVQNVDAHPALLLHLV